MTASTKKGARRGRRTRGSPPERAALRPARARHAPRLAGVPSHDALPQVRGARRRRPQGPAGSHVLAVAARPGPAHGRGGAHLVPQGPGRGGRGLPLGHRRNRDAEIAPLEGADWETDLAAWLAECEASRAVAATRGLDDTGSRRGEPCSLRWIYNHMIEEYSRHNGHADIIRELVDGARRAGDVQGSHSHRQGTHRLSCHAGQRWTPQPTPPSPTDGASAAAPTPPPGQTPRPHLARRDPDRPGPPPATARLPVSAARLPVSAPRPATDTGRRLPAAGPVGPRRHRGLPSRRPPRARQGPALGHHGLDRGRRAGCRRVRPVGGPGQRRTPPSSGSWAPDGARHWCPGAAPRLGGGGAFGAAGNGVFGTVASVGSNSFTVTDRTGASVTVQEQSSTAYYTGRTKPRPAR